MGIETEQNALGPSWVKSPLCPLFLVCSKRVYCSSKLFPSLLFSLSFKEQAHEQLLTGEVSECRNKEKQKLRKAMTTIQQ